MNAVELAESIMAEHSEFGINRNINSYQARTLARALLKAVEALDLISSLPGEGSDHGIQKLMTYDGAGGYEIAMQGVQQIARQALASIKGESDD